VYDVIVVGARCAGSPLAMLLARRGYRVLLLDRATFPSDTVSSHAVKKPAVARLMEWGLLEQIEASGCPPFSDMSLDIGPLVLQGTAPPAGAADRTYAPRRIVLDKILVDAAAAAGVEVREAFTVDELVGDDVDGERRVVGVRGHERGGPRVEERATLVVGADGHNSLVARTVAPETYADHGRLTAWYYTYWANLPASGVEFYLRPDRFMVCFPTNDELTLVATSLPVAAVDQFRADIEANYLQTIEMARPLAERVHGAERADRFFGAVDLPNQLRRPWGAGWALAGDAGFHKDPLTAEGISNAFRDAAVLADAIDAGLSGRQPLDSALARYQRLRDDDSMPLYELTCQLATLRPPPPDLAAILAGLPADQADTDRFFGVIEGTTPVGEFFAPDNARRIAARTSGTAAAPPSSLSR
jgi:2-polyprenyl-6-methoxyphenol hydroxylase-like FAD-dependent oxidoreductase